MHIYEKTDMADMKVKTHNNMVNTYFVAFYCTVAGYNFFVYDYLIEPTYFYSNWVFIMYSSIYI